MGITIFGSSKGTSLADRRSPPPNGWQNTIPTMKNPIQPIYTDHQGVVRFKPNPIVQALLESSPMGLNDIASMEFDPDDRIQFAQLIGYSVSGIPIYPGTEETIDAAERMSREGESEDKSRIAVLEEKLRQVRNQFRDGVATLYNIHPDDLE